MLYRDFGFGSAPRAMNFNPANNTLVVTFQNGKQYTHQKVLAVDATKLANCKTPKEVAKVYRNNIKRPKPPTPPKQGEQQKLDL